MTNILKSLPFNRSVTPKTVKVPVTKSAKVLFFHSTKRTNKHGKAPVYCRISMAGKLTQFSTGVFLTRKEWNGGDIITENTIDSDNYKALFGAIKSKILQAEIEVILQGKRTSANGLKNQLICKPDAFPSFIECFKTFLIRQESLIGVDFSKDQYVKKVRWFNIFVEFIKKKYRRNDIEIDEFREKLADDFFQYCRVEKKMSNDYFQDIIGLCKAVLKYAVLQEYIHTNFLEGYKVKKEKRKEIKALTINQVRLLQETNFATDALSKVKDCFLFQCYTGLAYIDLFNLNKEHIHMDTSGKYWIMIERQKSGIKATIPLLPPALEIICKYSGPMQNRHKY